MLHIDIIKAWLQAKVAADRGATLVEYALLVALIAVVCIGAISVLSGSIQGKFSQVGSTLEG